MTDQIKRVAAGVPAGGEFAAHNRPDADLQLERDRARANLYGAVAVSSPLFWEELPTWPANVPEPELSVVEWDDEPGTFTLYGKMGEGRNLVTVGVYRQGEDVLNTIDDGLEDTPYDEETEEQIVAYLSAVRQRVELVDSQILSAARAKFEGEMLDIALGRYEQPAIPTPTQPLSMAGDSIETARVRAHQMLAAHGYIDQGEGPKEAMQQAIADAMANLRHLADQHGIDFDEVASKADAYYDTELIDARFGDGPIF